MQNESSGDMAADARALLRDLMIYRQPNVARSVFELASTLALFALAWAAIWFSLDHGYWAGLILAVPAAGLLVRLFIIQHDCGHGSFFPSRRVNDWVGRLLGILTLTPYDYWRNSHALHHAGSGNLDRRGIGDINTLTVEEYRAHTPWRRFLYRVYRHPVVMFGIGPAFLFILQHRLPMGVTHGDRQVWISAMATNLGIAVVSAAVMWLVGVGPFLLIQLPITAIAASIGVWLFYVQHQFEDTSWDHEDEWSFHSAALHGSSHYDLPPVLRWFTGNIGIHHVHHLASRIPFYRLPEVLRDHPELVETGRLSLLDSIRSVPLVLWDPERRRLISFREMPETG